MNFDFLDDAPDEGSPADGHEHIETDLVDEQGRRIGFLIQRQTTNPPRRDVPPFIRWVSVTKDGEAIRNDYSSFHHTLKDAEAWVRERIRSSMSRYQRKAAVRASAGDFDFSTTRINTRRKPAKRGKTFVQSLDDTQRGLEAAGKNLRGCGCALIMLGLLILSPFIAALLM